MITISKNQARQFLVNHHRLNKKTNHSVENILDIVNHLGSMQYDPLNVVGRNPDLVLQARIKDYSSQTLTMLLYDKRRLIDGWDKMMCIYPIEDWTCFQRIREKHGKAALQTLAYRKSTKALELTEDILTYIAKNGPVQSSKLPGESAGKSRWGHKKLTGAAMDYLYAKGDLCVFNKSNTQKVYGLTAKIIPANVLNTKDPFQKDDDFITWYLHRRIRMMGLVWNKSGGSWLGYYLQKKRNRTPILEKLLTQKEIIQVRIEGLKDIFYVSKDHADELISTEEKSYKPFLRFLAPLDNFLWDRDMIETIFDFYYRWEVYTPVAKRQFGYYVLPLLYNYQLIGRIEFDYYRGEDNLVIKNTWFESTFTPDAEFETLFNLELKNFVDYLKRSFNS